jgi:hypothetical protein
MQGKELDQLYKDCVDFWGIERQIRMMQEECAELVIAGSHYLRGRKTGLEDLIEELADAQLMINQIKTFVGKENVKHMMDIKSDYIKKKLDSRKKEKADGK